jgi:hypothetical protein
MGIKVVRVGHTSEVSTSYLYFRIFEKHIPNTPVLNYGCKNDLFRIISDVWANPINHPLEMVVWTANDLRNRHVVAERFKNCCERLVEKLSAKSSED